MIDISEPLLGGEEEQLVLEVLRSGRLAQGRMVARFEEAFRDAVGARHAIALSSGTAALEAVLKCMEFEEGEEALTTPFTFVATVNAAIHARLRVRFADIGPDFNLDPQAVARAVTADTRVVIPVHLYGSHADILAIRDAAPGAEVVEDAAQAIGASSGGVPVGARGHAVFSFYATKNLTTGEGGMVATEDDALAHRLRLIRHQGMAERYQYEMPGHNYRMTELQAALGVAQMARLGAVTEARSLNASRLSEGLEGLPGITLPRIREGTVHSFHQYTIRVGEGFGMSRDDLAKHLRERGIGTGIYYPKLVCAYDAYRNHPLIEPCHAPEAQAASEQVLSLPVHPNLTSADLDRVIEAIRQLAP